MEEVRSHLDGKREVFESPSICNRRVPFATSTRDHVVTLNLPQRWFQARLPAGGRNERGVKRENGEPIYGTRN